MQIAKISRVEWKIKGIPFQDIMINFLYHQNDEAINDLITKYPQITNEEAIEYRDYFINNRKEIDGYWSVMQYSEFEKNKQKQFEFANQILEDAGRHIFQLEKVDASNCEFYLLRQVLLQMHNDRKELAKIVIKEYEIWKNLFANITG